MRCPDCAADKMDVKRTVQTLKRTTRTLACACGSMFESEETIVGRLSAPVDRGCVAGDPPVARGRSARGSPVADSSPRAGGGLGEIYPQSEAENPKPAKTAAEPEGTGTDPDPQKKPKQPKIRAPRADAAPTPSGVTAGAVIGWFVDAWSKRHGVRYQVRGPDSGQVVRMMAALPRPIVDQLPKLFERYVADPDPFVAKQGHSLAFFCTSGGVNKYRVTNGHNGAAHDIRRGLAPVNVTDEMSKMGRL